jgi:hypothetical protein
MPPAAKRGGLRREPGPFAPGRLVIVSLNDPHQKFWGVLREIAVAGVSVCGVELSSFDDFLALHRRGEAATAVEAFFPMHRVERVETDTQNGSIPSVEERFVNATGCSPSAVLGTNHNRSVRKR